MRTVLAICGAISLAACAPRLVPYWNETSDTRLTQVVDSLETTRATIAVSGAPAPYTPEQAKAGQDNLVRLEIARAALAETPAELNRRVDLQQGEAECAAGVKDFYDTWRRQGVVSLAYARIDLPVVIRTCRRIVELNRMVK